MLKLSDRINIGKTLEFQLQEVGITSIEKLIDTGSQMAWLKIKKNDSSACYNRLCALEGAIQNIRWHDLKETDKKKLKDFYEKHK